MPIKKLKVSFDLDMELFAKILAAGHTNMDIQAFGTDPTAEPAPAQITYRGGSRRAVLLALKDKPLSRTEMKDVIAANGYSRKSLDALIYTMRVAGLVRKVGEGTYAITKKGLAHVGT